MQGSFRKRAFFFLVSLFAAVSGSIALTPSPAQAVDAYGTYEASGCGVNFPWGAYCEGVMNKNASNNLKARLVAGDTVAAAAGFACSKIPSLPLAGSCVVLAAKKASEFRNAVNDAYADPNKCVAIRLYSGALGQAGGRSVSAVHCSYTGGYGPDSTCPSSFCGGGGGGGGGGGSWRAITRRE